MGEFIAGIVVDFITIVFGFLKNIDLSPVLTAIETLTPYFQFALYILPAETIAQIFTVVIAIWSMRLTIKAIKIIADFMNLF